MRISDKYCPWVNADVRALIKSRDKLKLAACKNKSKLLMSSYRQLRNKVNSLKTKLNRQYFATRVSKFKGNMKESWKSINLLSNKRSKSTNIDLLRDQYKIISNKGEISQSMNSFFCSIENDLSSKRERALATKVFPAISSNWQCLLLKILLYIYSTLHSKQVNFLALGKFLEFHQFSKMVTKPKSNYRPISVLPVVSRLFEKLVFNQLYQHLSDNCVINSNKPGFR